MRASSDLLTESAVCSSRTWSATGSVEMWWVRSAKLIARRSIRGLDVILGKTRNATCAFHLSGAAGMNPPEASRYQATVPCGASPPPHLGAARPGVRLPSIPARSGVISTPRSLLR